MELPSHESLSQRPTINSTFEDQQEQSKFEGSIKTSEYVFEGRNSLSSVNSQEKDQIPSNTIQISPNSMPTCLEKENQLYNAQFSKNFFGSLEKSLHLEPEKRPIYNIYFDSYERAKMAVEEYKKGENLDWFRLRNNLEALFSPELTNSDCKECSSSLKTSNILNIARNQNLAQMKKLYLEEPFSTIENLILATTSMIEDYYGSNNRYDLLEIKSHVLELHLKKSEKVYKRLPQEFLRLSELAIMETASYCEDFKTLWMEFFSSSNFFDTVDEAEFDIKQFNGLILERAKENLFKFSILQGVLNLENQAEPLKDTTNDNNSNKFENTQKKLTKRFERFSFYLGKAIFSYFQDIGKTARLLLERLDRKIQEAKFLTSHIAVSAVARLRTVLKAENSKNYKKIAYIMHVDSKILNRYWKQALLHFDKVFSPQPISVKDLNSKVSSIFLVERDGDSRAGVLLILDGSYKKFIIHRNSQKEVFLKNSDFMSNRWKIVSAKFASLEGLQGQLMKDCLNLCKQNGVWESTRREYEDLSEKPDKYSVCPLSRLLEDLVFSSRSLKDCVKNFTSGAGNSDGMLSFLVLQIPIVGGTFYTVMEFYGLGRRSNNLRQNSQIISGHKKRKNQ